jgi:hypothetical protein
MAIVFRSGYKKHLWLEIPELLCCRKFGAMMASLDDLKLRYFASLQKGIQNLLLFVFCIAAGVKVDLRMIPSHLRRKEETHHGRRIFIRTSFALGKRGGINQHLIEADDQKERPSSSGKIGLVNDISDRLPICCCRDSLSREKINTDACLTLPEVAEGLA